MTTSSRVVVYVDGFNLYFGLRSKGWKRYYWLNIGDLGREILTSDEALATVKYFTARISEPPWRAKRQRTFLEANAVLDTCEMFFGRYQPDPFTCHACGIETVVYHEKATDVFLATELLADVTRDRLDTAVMVTADADYAPVIRHVREFYPTKRVVVYAPPGRSSKGAPSARSFLQAHYRRGCLRKAMLPEEIPRT